jgi:hemerythrin HHE cation binding domain-containing protein
MSEPSDPGRPSGRPEPPHRIYEVMAAEHQRLEALLDLMESREQEANAETYQTFRETLLRHIRIEERVLLPIAKERNAGTPLALAARLRLDHGAFGAMMMLPPTPRVLAAVRAILRIHNPLEDGPGGVYERCDELVGPARPELLLKIQNVQKVPVSPYVDSPSVFSAARRVLSRAGYDELLLS